MKFIIGLLIFIMPFSVLSNEIVDCAGHSHINMETDGKLISVQAMFVIHFSKTNNGYISQSGEIQSGQKNHKIDRFFNIDILTINEAEGLFEFRFKKTTRQEPDSVPDDLPDNFLLNRQRIYKVQRTLVTSYLISDIYSPIFACHRRIKPR